LGLVVESENALLHDEDRMPADRVRRNSVVTRKSRVFAEAIDSRMRQPIDELNAKRALRSGAEPEDA
jgi:hypothetical protein